MSDKLLEKLRNNPYNKYRIEYLIEYLYKHDMVGKTLFDKLGLTAEDYILLCLQSDKIPKEKIVKLVNFLGIEYETFVIY